MRRAEHVFDALVIGSGFGGAVCAFRLAEQGRCVLVLERGRPYPPGSFARTPDEFRKAFWDPAAGLHGLFDLWRFRGLDIVCASGLGGGSLIYANVLLKKDAESFVREDLAAGGREHWPLRRDELEPHYENVCKMLAPQRYPYKETRKTRAIEHAAGALGFPVERPELAVLFAADASSEPVPGAPIVSDDLHRRPRCTCRLCGACDVGCNFGAKNTLAFTYLRAAARAGAPHVLRGAHHRAAARRRLPGRLSPAPVGSGRPPRRAARPGRGGGALGPRAAGDRGRGRGRLAAPAAAQPRGASRPEPGARHPRLRQRRRARGAARCTAPARPEPRPGDHGVDESSRGALAERARLRDTGRRRAGARGLVLGGAGAAEAPVARAPLCAS